MNRQQSRVAAKLDGKITVAHGVHRILGELRSAFRVNKAEQPGHQLAVERQSGASVRSAAQRTNVHPFETILQPLAVAFQHFHVGEQMMREINRLRPLQVRIAGYQHAGVLFAKSDQRALQRANVLCKSNDLVAQPHPRIQRHLVVA